MLEIIVKKLTAIDFHDFRLMNEIIFTVLSVPRVIIPFVSMTRRKRRGRKAIIKFFTALVRAIFF